MVIETFYSILKYIYIFLMLNELTFRLHVSPVLSGLVMLPWKRAFFKVRFKHAQMTSVL
jgi:hypothetical protein